MRSPSAKVFLCMWPLVGVERRGTVKNLVRFGLGTGLLTAVASLAVLSPGLSHEGASQLEASRLKKGMSQAEVEALLGAPMVRSRLVNPAPESLGDKAER